LSIHVYVSYACLFMFMFPMHVYSCLCFLCMPVRVCSYVSVPVSYRQRAVGWIKWRRAKTLRPLFLSQSGCLKLGCPRGFKGLSKGVPRTFQGVFTWVQSTFKGLSKYFQRVSTGFQHGFNRVSTTGFQIKFQNHPGSLAIKGQQWIATVSLLW